MAIESVSEFLTHWQRHFDPSSPKTRWERFWVSCHGTGVKWSVLVGLAVQTLSTLDCIMARTSILDAGPTIRFVFGIYSCTWFVYVYAFKREESLRTVTQLLAVAKAVERGLDNEYEDSEVKAMMRQTAARSRRYMHGMQFWSAFIFATVIPPAVLTGKPANPSWPEPTTPLGRYALLTLHLLSTVFLPVGYFPGVAMLSGLQNCATALLKALCKRMETAANEAQLQEAVALSSHLNRGLTMLNQLFRLEYMHILTSSLGMPLMATYEVLNGQIDPFIFASGPVNIIIFIPLCFAGQGVFDAGSAMCYSAYRGRWVEESTKCRHLRLQVMHRACQPAKITSRELGPINLALCQNALRSWFSFLNFMLNTQQRSKHESSEGD